MITVLFADIKGSMSAIEALDPEEAGAVMDPALAIMAEAVNRYGGSVAQSTGDGVFALFGSPLAHEDDPQRAIHAGLWIQSELRRYSDRLQADGKAPVEVRIGINTGEVVMRAVGKDTSHSEYLPAGHAVGLASRLQTLAPSGSIAIGEATRRLVEGYFKLKSLGSTRIKGVSEPVNIHEVTGIEALRTRFQIRASRGLSRFVGRDSEIAQMSRALELSREGHGQIVAAMAEPGWASRGCSSSSGRSIRPDAWCWKRFRSLTARPAPICRCSTCCIRTSISNPTMTHARGGRRSQARSRCTIARWKTRCPICSDCWASWTAPIRSPRWTDRSADGARSMRSSESSFASR
jgi:class 3 adenylate cyclase